MMNQTQKGKPKTLTLNQDSRILKHLLCFCINLYNNGVECLCVWCLYVDDDDEYDDKYEPQLFIQTPLWKNIKHTHTRL